MAALVATASIETSAPLSPSSSARRSIRAGMAVVSLALSGTASWPSTRRAVVAKAETRCSGGVPVARSWLRREVLPSMATNAGAVRPGRPHPGREGGREQARIDAVHQLREPAPARHAMMIGQIAAQHRQVLFAPFGHQIVVLAVADRPAHHEQQRLRQGM